MKSPRVCSHIKSNGVRCGSPALKYNTLCYFHYQWQNRRHYGRYYSDTKEGWTTMTLPPLETKASIIFAITEIQAALLGGHIENRIARTLLYGIQLAMQVNATEEDLASKAPDTCSELEHQLYEERCRHQRPPEPVCKTCERAELCASTAECLYSKDEIREFERIHDPRRYAGDRAKEETAQRLWDAKMAEMEVENARCIAVGSASASQAMKTSGPAISVSPSCPETAQPTSTSTNADPAPTLLPEPSPARESGESAQLTSTSTNADPAPTLLRELSPARECGESATNGVSSRACATADVMKSIF